MGTTPQQKTTKPQRKKAEPLGECAQCGDRITERNIGHFYRATGAFTCDLCHYADFG